MKALVCAAPKIPVLHMIKTLQLGGAERNLYNLVRYLDPQKVENHVGYCFGGEFEPAFERAGARLFKYSKKSHKLKSPASLVSVLRLAGHVRRHRIRIIHTHNFNGHVLGLVAARLTGAKLVEHVHDFRYIDKDTREQGRNFVEQYDWVRRLRGTSDRVIVLTEQNRQFLLGNRYYTNDRVLVLPNGIPMDEPRPAAAGLREKLGIAANRTVLLTPARMSPEKNIELLFGVASLVRSRRPEVLFLVAGDGPMLEEYRRRVRAEGLEGTVLFIGFHPETFELLALANLLLLPSFLELHPIAILEAMSMRVPVLASANVGCNSDVLHSWKDAVLLDPRDTGAWADAVTKLLEDPALGQRIADEAYRLCRSRFDIQRTAGLLEDLYAELARE